MSEGYFVEKELKQTDVTARISLAYEEKRARIASLWKLRPGSLDYRAEIKFLCCCREPYISAGCIVHGIGISVYEKAKVWKNKN